MSTCTAREQVIEGRCPTLRPYLREGGSEAEFRDVSLAMSDVSSTVELTADHQRTQRGAGESHQKGAEGHRFSAKQQLPGG